MGNKKSKLALFDLDGTLFDTKNVNFFSYQKAINELGYDVEYEFFCKECNGRLYREFLPKIIPNCSEETFEKVHKLKKELYFTNLKEARPNTHLFNIISLIKKEYILAVVTTASRKNAEDILTYFEKKDLFDLILTHEDITKVKPDPEGYLKAMKIFNISPENTVIFEDAEVGIESARRSGANVIIIDKF